MKNMFKLFIAVFVTGFLVGCGGGGNNEGGNEDNGGSGNSNTNTGSGYDQSAEDYTGTTYSNSIGISFIRVPAGVFKMGADSGDALSQIGEFPNEKQHQVNITKAYYLGKYEISAKEWESITGKDLFPGISAGRIPVAKITFSEIQEFIDKLNEKENRTLPDRPKYRLPTEAEWEYAARLNEDGEPTLTAWSFGNNPDELANYATYNKTGSIVASGGTKNATGLGFYDIYGHLFEYVSDWYDNDYGLTAEELADIIVDPKGPISGAERIVRGGSYLSKDLTPNEKENGWGNIRSAYRLAISDYNVRYTDIGFRLLLEIPDEAQ
jgi:formylglycine-generating enzyme required for sulfatase activity